MSVVNSTAAKAKNTAGTEPKRRKCRKAAFTPGDKFGNAVNALESNAFNAGTERKEPPADSENADLRNRLLVDYCPDAINQMQFHSLRLTPEQRNEILEIARRNSIRKPRLSEYCTSLNSYWIFAAIDSVIGDMENSREIDVMEPRLLYPFFLSLELEAASVMTPATLLYRLKVLVNAVYDVMPGFWDAIQWTAVIQEGISDSDYSIADVKAEAMSEGQARLNDCVQSELID